MCGRSFVRPRGFSDCSGGVRQHQADRIGSVPDSLAGSRRNLRQLVVRRWWRQSPHLQSSETRPGQPPGRVVEARAFGIEIRRTLEAKLRGKAQWRKLAQELAAGKWP